MRILSSGRLTLIAAFAAIYLIWGSTYLAIVFAIESMPPLLMLAGRFGVAGIVVFAWALWKGIPVPTGEEWRNAAVVGTLTLAAGTGAVAWAEQWVPSGVAALLVTTVPIWMVLLEWKWKGGTRPAPPVWWGLGLGLVGIVLLVNPSEAGLGGSRQVVGMLAILVAAITFSIGAILGRELALPSRPLMSTAAQMLTGGLALAIAGILRGETVSWGTITAESWAAWAYLMVFGSIIAYGSFVWLMKNAKPSHVSTYAYVNPVVAVVLGWFLGGETLTGAMFFAIALLLTAVLLITRFGGSRVGKVRARSRMANRSGAILNAFAHSMDPAVDSMGRRPLSAGRRFRVTFEAFAHSMDRPAESLPRT
ncbi:MAG: EamA family transporter [Rhodothermales bacterium]|nr:EamA family transporter [Rhodothermales bacterium]